MTGWQALGEFLRTDPQDVGCEQAMESWTSTSMSSARMALRRPGAASRVSPRTCVPAARAARTSTACSQPSPDRRLSAPGRHHSPAASPRDPLAVRR
jgi:hypothetical protein